MKIGKGSPDWVIVDNLNHRPGTMTIEINGKQVTAPENCTNLTQLLESQGLTGPGIAVAVAHHVVPRGNWDAIPLHEGMEITVIRAVCGG